MLAREALAAFQARYTRRNARPSARWIWVRIGPLKVPVPNPGKLVPHDLHHVLLEAPPTLEGEAHVGVFELRSGCATWLIWFLCAGSVLIGLVQRPRAVVRWWRMYRGCRSLYDHPELERLVGLDVDDLRRFVGLPPSLRSPASSTLETRASRPP